MKAFEYFLSAVSFLLLPYILFEESPEGIAREDCGAPQRVLLPAVSLLPARQEWANVRKTGRDQSQRQSKKNWKCPRGDSGDCVTVAPQETQLPVGWGIWLRKELATSQGPVAGASLRAPSVPEAPLLILKGKYTPQKFLKLQV